VRGLTAFELLKRPGRLELFIRKFREGEAFELVSGGKVKLAFREQTLADLESRDPKRIKDIRFVEADAFDVPRTFKASDLGKTKEFGSSGAGAGMDIEAVEIKSINDQLDAIKKEIGAVTVPIKIGHVVYQVDFCEKTKGVPKSDFHLKDIEGKEVIWVSHKDGKSARDFQQWGGMSLTVEPNTCKHPESQAFIKTLQEMYGATGIPNKTTVARKIQDRKLQNMAVYGQDFGKQLGRQNVSIVMQGSIKIVKEGNHYIFKSNHTLINGEEVDGDYLPVFMAIYKGDRSNFGVRGARFSISPIGSRKITAFV
jgi:hypothetical protein